MAVRTCQRGTRERKGALVLSSWRSAVTVVVDATPALAAAAVVAAAVDG